MEVVVRTVTFKKGLLVFRHLFNREQNHSDISLEMLNCQSAPEILWLLSLGMLNFLNCYFVFHCSPRWWLQHHLVLNLEGR